MLLALTKDIPVHHRDGLLAGIIVEPVDECDGGPCWIRYEDSQYLLYEGEYAVLEQDTKLPELNGSDKI